MSREGKHGPYKKADRPRKPYRTAKTTAMERWIEQEARDSHRKGGGWDVVDQVV